MLNPGLVIFDMDGLMFDTERLLLKHVIDAAATLGQTITPDVYKGIIGSGGGNVKEVFNEHYNGDCPIEEAIEIVTNMAMDGMKKEIMTNGLPIKKGLVKLLDYLKEADIECCIASSSPLILVQTYLQLSGVAPYFSGIISGDSVKETKPNPEIFLKALEQFNVAPEDALVLEDSKNGITAAYKANIPSVCIPDLFVPDREMIEQATLITSSLDNLINLIDDGNIANCA